MTGQLYPLNFKPGIKRDGAQFQGEYCTDGTWVRWQRGFVRKMGGMKAVGTYITNNNNLDSFLFNPMGNDILTIAGPNNTYYIYSFISAHYVPYNERPILLAGYKCINNDFTQSSDTSVEINGGSGYYGQITSIVNSQTNEKLIIFYITPSTTINATGAAVLNYAPAFTDIFQQAPNRLIIYEGGDGGICSYYPYLFVYGTNGTVICSASNNPLNFIPSQDPNIPGGLKITLPVSDKVIYGAPTRGGTAAPTLLFWTLSSVVLLSNIGEDSLIFKPTVISQSSSIMSSKCVVEYDGFFFWPGVDRFFVYNGIVNELSNPMNLNFFFDNIDMNKRQMVFGVKNLKYGEIWWYFPEKQYAGNPDIGCTRVIIYNKRENSWYDTSIANLAVDNNDVRSRAAGDFFEENGIMYTYGIPMVSNTTSKYSFIFAHEIGWNEVVPEQVGQNPGFISTPIPSSFTTPIFSFASFNPLKQVTGTDRWTYMQRFEPDFRQNDKANNITLTVQVKKYPQSDFAPNIINTQYNQFTFNGNTDFISMSVQGRQIRCVFSTNYFFEMGSPFMLLSVGDAQ